MAVSRYLLPVFCGVLLLAESNVPTATAQSANAAAHVAAAKAAAYEPGQDFTDMFGLCAEPKPRAVPASTPAEAPAARVPAALPRSQWYMEPAKVFDNLYYVGTALGGNGTAWAITTSEGIILI